MAMNDLTIEQCSTLLNAIVNQATGKNPVLTTTNTKDFVTVAQTALKTGYDPIINAISQVLSKTIFSVRPYNRKFKGLEVSAQRWGNHVRKLNMIDGTFVDNDELNLTDGQSLDPWLINKPKVLQTNFYGEIAYSRYTTYFQNQLDTAFSRPSEFASFISMQMSNISDQISQADEELDRAAICNFIGGKYVGDTNSVIHLVTEYNAYCGGSYTPTTIKDPTVYEPFIKWVFGRIKTIGSMMSERSVKFHINVTNKVIMRHTPSQNLKIYLFAPVLNDISASVLSDVYNSDILKFADHESVSYWQNIDTPDSINVDATYMKNDGTLTNTGATTIENVFGIMFDEEAIGTNTCNQSVIDSGLNARGKYNTTWYHWTRRYWNDFSENGVVLLLD